MRRAPARQRPCSGWGSGSDKDNEEIKLEGVTFDVLDKDGNVLETITTDSNGEAITSQYALRDYDSIYLKETSTNKNYVLNDEITEVKLENNQLTEVKISNEYKKGNLKIYKIDKDDNNIALSNVTFELYNEEDKLIGTYTTDEDGEINIENLKIGKYKLKEIKTDEWYNLANEVNVEIKWNETTEVTIENELKKGQIRVIKVDSEDNEIKIEGAKFEVLDEDGNVLETISTDNKGEAITSEYALKDYNHIYLKEIETDEKHILNDEILQVELKANEVKDITIENDRIKGQIKIIKTSADDNKVTGEKAGTPLEGVVFEIYAHDVMFAEKVADKKITVKDGYIDSIEEK